MLGETADGSAAWPAALAGLGYGLLAGAASAVALIGGTTVYLAAIMRLEEEG
jgi:hypothetical protein